MGEYSELLEKYKNFEDEKNRKEIIKIFPKKQGKVMVPIEKKILIPHGKTLVFFSSDLKNASISSIIEKFDNQLDCNIVSISEIIKSYSKEKDIFRIVDDVLEEELISSLDDGCVTVIDYVYTDILNRALLLKRFYNYYTSAINITISSYNDNCKEKHDILKFVDSFNIERKNKYRMGVDINYIILDEEEYDVKIVPYIKV